MLSRLHRLRVEEGDSVLLVDNGADPGAGGPRGDACARAGIVLLRTQPRRAARQRAVDRVHRCRHRSSSRPSRPLLRRGPRGDGRPSGRRGARSGGRPRVSTYPPCRATRRSRPRWASTTRWHAGATAMPRPRTWPCAGQRSTGRWLCPRYSLRWRRGPLLPPPRCRLAPGTRPSAVVTHHNRVTLRALARQRARHGSGAAWLDRHYPGRFPPARSLGKLKWSAGAAGRSRAIAASPETATQPFSRRWT